jgi:hypothetical protein
MFHSLRSTTRAKVLRILVPSQFRLEQCPMACQAICRTLPTASGIWLCIQKACPCVPKCAWWEKPPLTPSLVDVYDLVVALEKGLSLSDGVEYGQVVLPIGSLAKQTAYAGPSIPLRYY